MKSFIYELSMGKVEIKGRLLKSEVVHEGQSESRTHLGNGQYSVEILESTDYKEVWEVTKTDGSKEVVELLRIKLEREGREIRNDIFWEDFVSKVYYDHEKEQYNEVKLAEEYGVITRG